MIVRRVVNAMVCEMYVTMFCYEKQNQNYPFGNRQKHFIVHFENSTSLGTRRGTLLVESQFWPKIWGISMMQGKKITSITWKTRKSGILKFYEFFQFLMFSSI